MRPSAEGVLRQWKLIRRSFRATILDLESRSHSCPCRMRSRWLGSLRDEYVALLRVSLRLFIVPSENFSLVPFL